jgi:hypothetical protein
VFEANQVRVGRPAQSMCHPWVLVVADAKEFDTGCHSHSVCVLSALHAQMFMETLGRGGEGGDGQKIRDDILNIMHK